MNKKLYSKVPRPLVTEEMITFTEKEKSLKYLVTAEDMQDGDEIVLVINFFEKNSLKDGMKTADFRTFFTEEDYITQDLSKTNSKWLTAGLWNLLDIGYYSGEKQEAVVYTSNDLKKISNYFRKYETSYDKSALSKVYTFQEKVRQKRLEKRHKKETDPIDELMKQVLPVPKDFEEWVHEDAMSFSQYLFYTPTDKNKAVCECSYCRAETVVDRKDIRLRNNEKGVCPSCGKKVTHKVKGKLPYRISDQCWVVYIQQTEKGFIWRYFHIQRHFERSEVPRYKDSYSEYSRTFYSFDRKGMRSNSYEYTQFKQTGVTRWCHDEGRINCGLCTLYPGNLPQAWEHTPMKYSALEVLSRNIPSCSLHYEWGIKRYLKFSKLEWLCKMGLNSLAKAVINERGDYTTSQRINLNGQTIYDILKLTKLNTQILQKIDGDTDALRLLQVAQSKGIIFKPQQLKEYNETFGCNTELLRSTKRKVSLHKLVRYITKESEKYPIGEEGGCHRYAYHRYTERLDPRIEKKQNMAKDWLEYIEWCKELKYDLNNMFIYMPNNFKKVHDRVAKEYQALKDKKAAAEKRRIEKEAKKRMEQTKKAMEEILAKSEGVDAFSIKGKGLVLVIPRNGEEIKAEGSALHHCVGTYVDKIARGETSIFFIRKTETPEKPYYTMEWRDNKVQQCRGFKQCNMTPEVKAFTEVFAKKMKESIEKQTA